MDAAQQPPSQGQCITVPRSFPRGRGDTRAYLEQMGLEVRENGSAGYEVGLPPGWITSTSGKWTELRGPRGRIVAIFRSRKESWVKRPLN